MGVRLNAKHENESNDDEILDEISLDTSWLDSKTNNSSIEMLDGMDVDNIIPVSKTIDGNRDRFVYDGKQDDSMTEEYFPDIAFEEPSEFVQEDESKINKKSNKALLVVAIVAFVIIALVLSVLLLGYLGIDIAPAFMGISKYV